MNKTVEAILEAVEKYHKEQNDLDRALCKLASIEYRNKCFMAKIGKVPACFYKHVRDAKKEVKACLKRITTAEQSILMYCSR